MNDTIATEFGGAKLTSEGYYKISTRKEGNNGIWLHRLLYCKYHNCSLEDIKGLIVHHKDGNPLNNCVENLQLMKKDEHTSLHNKGENNPFFGKKHSEETKRKMSELKKGEKHPFFGKKGENHPSYGKNLSEKTKRRMSFSRNTTGYRNVYKRKDSHCKQGFIWVYQYYEDNKYKKISRVNIDDLKEAVLKKGLVWEEYSKQEM